MFSTYLLLPLDGKRFQKRIDSQIVSGNEKRTIFMSRDSFGSRFGALVAMAGSAVGLGNF